MSPNSDSHARDQTSGGGNLKIIDLEFETLRQFREVMAPRLAYEGFFVATNEPLAKGTPARFRFLLPDGFVLVEGTAVVAWARFESGDPEKRPGMALLFNELEHQSREIIDELMDFHIATGGDPFEIGPLASDPGDIGTDALGVDPLETTVPVPEPEPAPDPPEASGQDGGGCSPGLVVRSRSETRCRPLLRPGDSFWSDPRARECTDSGSRTCTAGFRDQSDA